ncbi:putative inhibitor of apoptosis [Babylonia areolata]|uniref:putative inhibitor of apoptosis n=1 Tax=Babylonia areolata TaxID=304850 RepID=UPI003FD395E4
MLLGTHVEGLGMFQEWKTTDSRRSCHTGNYQLATAQGVTPWQRNNDTLKKSLVSFRINRLSATCIDADFLAAPITIIITKLLNYVLLSHRVFTPCPPLRRTENHGNCWHSDKAVCYSCGVELYDWSKEADVWITHAAVSPTCLHVISCKGEDFITQALNQQVLAEVKYPKDSSAGVSGSGGVVGEEPGSSVLDMTAVKAALACRYPNEAILKASLKAADENHITICRQQQVVRQTFTQLQQKDTQLQQQGAQLQQQGAQLQQKDTQLQQQGAQLRAQLQQKDTQLQEKEQTVQTLNEQLDEKEEQLRWQDRQIQSLMQQVQRLRADHHHRAPLEAEPQGDDANNAGPRNGDDGGHSLVCKICMSDKPRMIFLPCGHLFSCAECTSRLPDKRCPVCRQDISEVLPAFVA